MWNQPATARQIAALKANGNFDGKYYSKGRAGQTIGESTRSAAGTPAAAFGRNELAVVAELIGSMRPEAEQPASNSPRIVVGNVVEGAGAGGGHRMTDSQPAGVLSLDFIGALESRHLNDYRANHSYGSGSGLRQETQAWNKLKLEVATGITEGLAAVADVLRDAPAGVVPMPNAAASTLLASAVDPDLEERHLLGYLDNHTYGSANGLRTEILDWLENRIALAATNAQGLIDLARTRSELTPTVPVANVRSPLPPESGSSAGVAEGTTATASSPNASKARQAPLRGAVSVGTVTSINAHGARVKLTGGEQGWLHISKLRVLNGGARVADVADHLRVGQELKVRHIGTDQRGGNLLELADLKAVDANANAPSAPKSAEQDLPSAERGPAKRFGLFRRRAAKNDHE